MTTAWQKSASSSISGSTVETAGELLTATGLAAIATACLIVFAVAPAVSLVALLPFARV